MKHEELTEKIIKIFYKVYNTLARPTRQSGLLKRYFNVLYLRLT
jgi:hypothetical protein